MQLQLPVKVKLHTWLLYRMQQWRNHWGETENQFIIRSLTRLITGYFLYYPSIRSSILRKLAPYTSLKYLGLYFSTGNIAMRRAERKVDPKIATLNSIIRNWRGLKREDDCWWVRHASPHGALVWSGAINIPNKVVIVYGIVS